MQKGLPEAAEVFAFWASTMLYIWVLRDRWPAAIALPCGIAICALLRHHESTRSLGLTWREFVCAFREWWLWMALGLVAAGFTARTAGQVGILYRGGRYLLWCVVQQFVLQIVVYRRLRCAFGPAWTTGVISGALFAAAHLPNPVLVPATFLWGVLSTRLFERHPSVWALAILQTFASATLLSITPAGTAHQFRVGPGYWRWPGPAH